MFSLFSFQGAILNFELVCIFFVRQAYTYTRRAKKCKIIEIGGLKWTRTTDLTLIRRAL